MKKIVLVSAALALVALGGVAPSVVQAKSVKWSCVALDPGTPWVMTCYASTRRP